MKKKITCLSAFVAVLVAVGCISFGCTDDFFDFEDNVLSGSKPVSGVSGEITWSPIALGDVPKDVIPLEFESFEEAEVFMKEAVASMAEKNTPVLVEVAPLDVKIPLLKTRSESTTGVIPPKPAPKGAVSMEFGDFFFCSLKAYISYEKHSITKITSALVGLSPGISWEQKIYTGGSLTLVDEGEGDNQILKWGLPFSVRGVFEVYVLIDGLGRLGSVEWGASNIYIF